ncbi:Inducer of phenazine A [Solwaraspora sp. WMMD406]|uniref:Inducer of phenazine A n=1 Tax=Solwaraspora sp. WMMD406 TaxID=3016095 RepID=UPI002415D38F|nr:Inducer of phenazine A [Solwaraspora sp. WMMD406]MDG4767442.1 Inducer of phenazine A [Solwaraspora sp. WMMD406]
MSARAALTPQMLQYDDFDDRSQTRWLPYLMYFHRADYRSDVITTDRLGFRPSQGPQGPDGAGHAGQASAGARLPDGSVRLLVGSSSAFGIGVTADDQTMATLLWSRYAPSKPWLNFAGRSFNSTQEAMLFLLFRHLLPPIDEIVFFSGLNDLALSRLPAEQRGEHGAFFNCGEYFNAMETLRAAHRKPQGRLGRRLRAGGGTASPTEPEVRPLPERVSGAVELTARNLDSWRLLAPDARISYVLQPLATWIRDDPAPEERQLFGELDEISNFWQLYGDIATRETGRTYAAQLREACEKRDIRFVDISPALAETVSPTDWMFVDRAHFTDLGSDIVTRVLAEQLELS